MRIGLGVGVTSQFARDKFAAARLYLDFTKGTLDPRITFTRNSTATFFNASGVLSSASANTPRFDYDPVTLAARGLLIEEQRTNLLTYSEQFDNAAWVKTNATVTQNSTAAPDGQTTADKLVENTATGNHRVFNNTISLTSGIAYTLSVYAKASERSLLQVELRDAVGAIANGTFNLSTLAITGTSGISQTITSVGNGWYRLTVSGTAANTGLGTFLYFINNGSSNSYTGDGTSGIFLWGAQLEAGAFATSYIPTTTAQVTRIADSATMTGTNFSSWYNQSAMTFYAEWASEYTASATVPSATPHVLQAYNAAASNNNYGIRGAEASTTQGCVARNPTAGIQFPGLSGVGYAQAGVFRKLGYAISASDLQVAVNGVAGTAIANNAAALMATHDKMDIGSGTGGTSPYSINGWIRRIAYYPRRLTNSELQAITS